MLGPRGQTGAKGFGRGQNEENERKNYANGHLQQKAEQRGPGLCCHHRGENPFQQWLQDLPPVIIHSVFPPCRIKQCFPHILVSNSAFNHKQSKSIFHFQTKQSEAKLFFLLPRNPEKAPYAGELKINQIFPTEV